MLQPQQLPRPPDLHVGKEMPTAQGFKKLERLCFNVDSGDLQDSASGIPSASKSGLSPGQISEGAGGPGDASGGCLGTPQVMGEGPQTWKVGCGVTGWDRRPPRWHWCWGLGLWEDGQCRRVETFHCHLGLSL